MFVVQLYKMCFGFIKYLKLTFCERVFASLCTPENNNNNNKNKQTNKQTIKQTDRQNNTKLNSFTMMITAC